MVAQEDAPSLAGWPASLDHVFGDTRLRYLKPELAPRECVVHPTVDSPCSSAGSVRAAPPRFVAALPSTRLPARLTGGLHFPYRQLILPAPGGLQRCPREGM